MRRTQLTFAGCETGGGRGHKSRSVGGLGKLEEAGKGVLQRGPRQRLQKRKRPSPGFEPGEAHGRLPAHSTRGQDIGVV